MPNLDNLSKDIQEIVLEYGKEVAKQVTAELQPIIDGLKSERDNYRQSSNDLLTLNVNLQNEVDKLKRETKAKNIATGVGIGFGVLGIASIVGTIIWAMNK